MVVTLQNRRDQVQAHTFMVGRLQSALLKAEPDLATPPLRRTSSGLLIGGILATLGVAGAAVYALISPGGNSSWRDAGTLVVDKTTGTSYVWVDQSLRPVLNLASARLLLGEDMTVEDVTSSSLEGVRRGAAIGIDQAPETLPAATISTSAWQVCATTAVAADGDARAAVSLRIGSLTPTAPIRDDQALLVRTTGGTRYLVTGGRRLKITEDWVPRALGLDDHATLDVTTSWIDALPAGPDLPQPTGVKAGAKGPSLAGIRTTAGQIVVVHTAGSPDRYYLVTLDGLQAVTETAAAIVLGDPGTTKAYGKNPVEAVSLSPAALGMAEVAEAPAWQAQLPASPMTLADTGSQAMPCVRAVPTGGTVTLDVITVPREQAVASSTLRAGAAGSGAVPAGPGGATPSAPSGGSGEKKPTAATSGATVTPADQVGIAAGAGLLARTLPAPGVPGAGLYLVTEDGSKYPIASAEALTALGYSDSQATAVPANLLGLLPTGPVLELLGTGGDVAAS
ncbi:type VII secretion protein EccB [Kineosporia sp. J2-2]|uniref:Type VII secretion protein EccB n=1 Tax=Kineosporia corallincola TaxID=2835133 RepID=A0ABS5TGG6_9ACTN|nr:type VII secretion protein EccB [Kineosporia corallincola]MBT0770190.1 type VII secretion protein EccB [Kineosporia corallincola]